MTTKRFCDYQDNELPELSNEQLNDAIRIEAIQRGIKPPITLPDALRQSEYVGYRAPAESVKVYRIRVGYEVSDFGWLDEQQAIRAAEGVVKLSVKNYQTKELGFSTETPSVEAVVIGVVPSSDKAAKFEAYMGDESDEFDKLRDECIERVGRVRQERYNAEVRARKQAEYLRLAGGNIEIAQAFWAKTEGTSWNS